MCTKSLSIDASLVCFDEIRSTNSAYFRRWQISSTVNSRAGALRESNRALSASSLGLSRTSSGYWGGTDNSSQRKLHRTRTSKTMRRTTSRSKQSMRRVLSGKIATRTNTESNRSAPRGSSGTPGVNRGSSGAMAPSASSRQLKRRGSSRVSKLQLNPEVTLFPNTSTAARVDSFYKPVAAAEDPSKNYDRVPSLATMQTYMQQRGSGGKSGYRASRRSRANTRQNRSTFQSQSVSRRERDEPAPAGAPDGAYVPAGNVRVNLSAMAEAALARNTGAGGGAVNAVSLHDSCQGVVLSLSSMRGILAAIRDDAKQVNAAQCYTSANRVYEHARQVSITAANQFKSKVSSETHRHCRDLTVASRNLNEAGAQLSNAIKAMTDPTGTQQLDPTAVADAADLCRKYCDQVATAIAPLLPPTYMCDVAVSNSASCADWRRAWLTSTLGGAASADDEQRSTSRALRIYTYPTSAEHECAGVPSRSKRNDTDDMQARRVRHLLLHNECIERVDSAEEADFIYVELDVEWKDAVCFNAVFRAIQGDVVLFEQHFGVSGQHWLRRRSAHIVNAMALSARIWNDARIFGEQWRHSVFEGPLFIVRAPPAVVIDTFHRAMRASVIVMPSVHALSTNDLSDRCASELSETDTSSRAILKACARSALIAYCRTPMDMCGNVRRARRLSMTDQQEAIAPAFGAYDNDIDRERSASLESERRVSSTECVEAANHASFCLVPPSHTDLTAQRFYQCIASASIPVILRSLNDSKASFPFALAEQLHGQQFEMDQLSVSLEINSDAKSIMSALRSMRRGDGAERLVSLLRNVVAARDAFSLSTHSVDEGPSKLELALIDRLERHLEEMVSHVGGVRRLSSAQVHRAHWRFLRIRDECPLEASSDRSLVFVIGYHKTGTTSMEGALKTLSWRPASWSDNLPRIVDDHPNGLYENAAYLIGTKRYLSFQDMPWPMLYRWLDSNFPKSKFILTKRTTLSWAQSIVRFFDDESVLRSLNYGAMHSRPLHNEERYVTVYEQHNEAVQRYFIARVQQLLTVDLERGDGAEQWAALCTFLNVTEMPDTPFPHRNSIVHGADNASSTRNAGVMMRGEAIRSEAAEAGKPLSGAALFSKVPLRSFSECPFFSKRTECEPSENASTRFDFACSSVRGRCRAHCRTHWPSTRASRKVLFIGGVRVQELAETYVCMQFPRLQEAYVSVRPRSLHVSCNTTQKLQFTLHKWTEMSPLRVCDGQIHRVGALGVAVLGDICDAALARYDIVGGAQVFVIGGHALNLISAHGWHVLEDVLLETMKVRVADLTAVVVNDVDTFDTADRCGRQGSPLNIFELLRAFELLDFSGMVVRAQSDEARVMGGAVVIDDADACAFRSVNVTRVCRPPLWQIEERARAISRLIN